MKDKLHWKILRWKQKIGETLPADNIMPFEEYKNVFNERCECATPYYIKQPLGHIEHLPRYYDEFCYKCLNCEWKSIILKTRTL